MNTAPLAIASGSAADAETNLQLRASLEFKETERANLADTLRRTREMHRADIDAIGERLMKEAERRDWCAEYDTIIDELNVGLNVELPTRERSYTVTATVRVEITLDARDEDHARSIAGSIADDLERLLDAEDQVMSYWESSHNFEVEEG